MRKYCLPGRILIVVLFLIGSVLIPVVSVVAVVVARVAGVVTGVGVVVRGGVVVDNVRVALVTYTSLITFSK